MCFFSISLSYAYISIISTILFSLGLVYFNNFLSQIFKSFVFRLSFLIQAFEAINPLLSLALIASNLSCSVVFFIIIQLEMFSNFHHNFCFGYWLLRKIWLNFQTFKNFLIFFVVVVIAYVKLNSNVVSENFSPVNLFIPASWSHIGLLFVNVPLALAKNVYLQSLEARFCIHQSIQIS